MKERFQPAIPAEHAAHDGVWMAALASRDPDLSPSERARAEAVLESCGACAELFADLVAVSAAIPSATIPARPRDFTLTAADAARLGRRGLRRWLSAIGSARDGITFPLAMGLTTMGIAGLLLATVPALYSGGGPTSQVLSTVGAPIPAPAASAAASAAPAPASAAPAAAEGTDLRAMSAAPSSETAGEGEVFSGDDGDAVGGQREDSAEMAQEAIRDDATGLSALFLVAATLLVVGLGLFALRWSARRLGDG
jgi:hypothetical protein